MNKYCLYIPLSHTSIITIHLIIISALHLRCLYCIVHTLLHSASTLQHIRKEVWGPRVELRGPNSKGRTSSARSIVVDNYGSEIFGSRSNPNDFPLQIIGWLMSLPNIPMGFSSKIITYILHTSAFTHSRLIWIIEIINILGTSIQSSSRVQVLGLLMRVLSKPMIVSLRYEY